MIENANAPIIRVDKDLKIVVWNARTVFQTGFTKEEAIGQNLVEKFIDKESRPSVREVLRKALVDGLNTENYELPLFTKQGARREMLLSATAILEPDGTISGEATPLRRRCRVARRAVDSMQLNLTLPVDRAHAKSRVI